MTAEDREFERAEVRAGVQAELLAQPGGIRPEGVKRVDWPVRPVQGLHELAEQPFPHRVPGAQRGELRDETLSVTHRELQREPLLRGGEAPLGQRMYLGCVQRVSRHVRQDRTPPQPAGLP